MTKMKYLLLPFLFWILATANAQGGSVVDTKAEARKAAKAYIQKCASNVRKSRTVLLSRHRAEQDALGKSVNTPEYRALQERQQKERKYAWRIHARDQKIVRQYAREAIQENKVINVHFASNVCYYVPRF